MNDSLLQYYHEELSYLREKGAAFAQAHPKVGARLRLTPGSVEDPLVGRLLESFSFLTARLRHQLNHELETLSESVLTILYPHYLLPIPSVSTIQFAPKLQMDKAVTIPRNTLIVSQTADHQKCYFKTGYDTILAPIRITEAQYGRENSIKTQLPKKDLKAYVSIQLSALKPEAGLSKQVPNRVRFHIQNKAHMGYLLYEQLLNDVQEIVIAYGPASEGKTISVPRSALEGVGFGETESLFPYPPQSFKGYRLLTEFFSFPEKFLYVDLVGLDQLLQAHMGSAVTIYFFMRHFNPSLASEINSETFQLGCTPMINLFEVSGEPIRLDHRQSEYQVIPDAHRPLSGIEVYQICALDVASEKGQEVSAVPYFGKKFQDATPENTLYFQQIRRTCSELGFYHVPGNETFVAFSDQHAFPEGLVITPQLTCTNRDLPTQLPFGGEGPVFQFADQPYEWVQSIRCVSPLLPPRYRDKAKVTQQDLVAHITLNQLSFEDPNETLTVLRELLSLYHYDHPVQEELVSKGLLSARCERKMERHPSLLKQGFCSGVVFYITVDESFFPEHSLYLFGSVLQAFLSKTASVNSFVQLVLSSKQRGEVARWKPILGTQNTL